uniref:Uncharacterized protein n=1 Tax=Aceria tosichella TaxID=561515 RepID=A0A6G1S5U9_9ACAR
MSPATNCLVIGSILIVIPLALYLPAQVHMQQQQHDDDNSGNQEQIATITTTSHLMRKSIVFDLKTPKVFYCPQEKPSDSDKMIVKARPLDSLCEYHGQAKPKGAPSDCYNDVDETDFACDEKKRFMIRLDLASEMGDYGLESDPDYILTKGPAASRNKKKKTSPNGKKF